MVEIPEGPFTMGAPTGNEQPVREVFVSRFFIDATEVTQGAHQDCVNDGACEPPAGPMGLPCYGPDGFGDQRPVGCMSWFHAEAYCAWAGKRLPTEAEWEKAARGNDARTYPWGFMPEPSCELAVMDDGDGPGCGENRAWDVGSKPAGASVYGLMDTSGNALEWVADWYADAYDPSDTMDPLGPAMGTERVVRSAAWGAPAAMMHTSVRFGSDPLVTPSTLGIRCAMTP